MSALTTISTYFSLLAAEYSPIGHTPQRPRYFRNTKAAITIADVPPGLLMFLSPIDGSYQERDGSETRQLALSLTIMRNHEPKDYKAMDAAYDETFQHCEQILARMLQDRRDGDCLLYGFALDDAQIVQEDPFWDGWVGCSLLLRMLNPFQLQINPILWPDPEE